MSTTEFSAGKRGRGTFPAHWRGIYDGQSSEERAAVIVENMAADHAARGDHDKAEATIRSYRTVGQSDRRSAADALDTVRRISRG